MRKWRPVAWPGLALLIFFAAAPALVLAHGGTESSAAAEVVERAVLLLHIVTAVFMAWPLYALITVNERPQVPAAVGDAVDDFLEGIVRKNARRCAVYQSTALLTGLYLAWSHADLGLGALRTNPALFGKLLGLLVLMGLLATVVFRIQPQIDRQFAVLKRGGPPPEAVARIRALRGRRKRIAATCLAVLLAVLLLAVQIRAPFPAFANVAFLAAIALFT